MPTLACSLKLFTFGLEVVQLPLSASTSVTIAVNAVGVPARVIPPFIADHVGQFNVMAPTLAIMTVVAFCWIAVNDGS